MIEKRICPKCGKEFEIDTSKSNRIYCSRSCANGHKHSKETKEKLSKQILQKINNGEVVGFIKPTIKSKKYFCKICGKEIIGNKSRFCSDECKHVNNFSKTLIKYFGLNEFDFGSNKIYEKIDEIKNNLYDLYWNQNLTSVEICKRFNYPNVGNLTGKIFKYLGIPSKSCKDKNKESVFYRKKLEDLRSQYKHGWFKTWNNKEVYLRSSFEFNYANFLNSNKIDYDVECFRIKYFDSVKNEFRCAIPDFYLIESNTLVEIKSDWTLDIQNMKDKFDEYKKLGYNVKLILNNKEVDLYSL